MFSHVANALALAFAALQDWCCWSRIALVLRTVALARSFVELETRLALCDRTHTSAFGLIKVGCSTMTVFGLL
jgi:hypothetical protein